MSRFRLACRLSSSARYDFGGLSSFAPVASCDIKAPLLDDEYIDSLLCDDAIDAWVCDSCSPLGVRDGSRMDVGD